MEKNGESPKTIGRAIDEIIQALRSLGGDEQVTAIRAACEHLKIRAPEGLASKAQTSPGAPVTEPLYSSTQAGPVDIRSLRQQKQPSTANEMAALVAFYLSELASENDRKAEVQQKDMVKYFKQGGYPLPKQPRVLLTNAKNSGYFDFLGEGRYRLNAVGYNLVAHNLPRIQSKSAAETRRKRRKTRTASARQRAKR